MTGVSFWEFLFICMIGLIVLGPERLPKVANQLGSWVGQARRMTRTMRRQLEEEIDLDIDIEKELGIDSLNHPIPHDDDTYSPLHQQPESSVATSSAAKDDEQAVEAAVADADADTGQSDPVQNPDLNPDLNPDPNQDKDNEQQKLA